MAKKVYEPLNERISKVAKEIGKPGNWMFRHYRALLLLEGQIRRQAKKYMDDPTGYELDFTAGQLKLLISKMRTKLMKVTDVELILKELGKHKLVDDDVFVKVLKPYVDFYYPLAINIQDLLNRLSYIAITLDLYERQDHEACFLQAAILDAIKEA